MRRYSVSLPCRQRRAIARRYSASLARRQRVAKSVNFGQFISQFVSFDANMARQPYKIAILLYLLTRPITCSSRLGLQLLLPDAVACSELYESLNILTFLSELLITQWRANFMAHSSAANTVMLSVSLAVCSMLNSGIQKAADVLLSIQLQMHR